MTEHSPIYTVSSVFISLLCLFNKFHCKWTIYKGSADLVFDSFQLKVTAVRINLQQLHKHKNTHTHIHPAKNHTHTYRGTGGH